MFPKLLTLFVAVPLVELFLLIKLGEWMGFWPTVWLVITTGFIGASLARWQGFTVLSRIQQDLAIGRMPADKIVDGLMILIGGIVLLTPGLLTDCLGFLLMIPAFRNFARKLAKGRFQNWMNSHTTHIRVDPGQQVWENEDHYRIR